MVPEDAHIAVGQLERKDGKSSIGYRHSLALAEKRRGNDLFRDVGNV